MSYNAVVRVVALLTLFTAFVLCWFNAPLIWDGSYQLCRTLIDQHPFFYYTRFHSYPLWWPVVWLSRVTDNLHALVFAFGLPFCLTPAVSLLLSWWFVRRTAPWLILWATLGTYATALPGQMFLINDSIFQQHLFWPFYLGLFVPLTPLQIAVLVILAAFQLSHPLGGLLLLGAAIATASLAILDIPNRRRWLARTLLVLGLCIAAWGKILLWPDPYAYQEASFQMARSRFHDGVLGWPVIGIVCIWLCALCAWCAGKHSTNGSLRRKLRLCAAAALVFAGLALIIWAAEPQRWASAINYRRWAAPLTLPVFALAFFETLNPPRDAGLLSRSRSRLMLGCGLVFAVVLSWQALTWSNLTRRLMSEVGSRSGPLVTFESLQSPHSTALDHWSIASLVLISQGRNPTKLVLTSASITALDGPAPKLELGSWDLQPIRPGRVDWFDFSSILEQLHKQKNSAK